ncbi:MAG: hemagglutinin [Bactrocera correcta orthomyxo-like virus isolate Bz]|nr:MAG: hemagglutinin [Bactrocera correcta orthomyxo-like virus isolate Bz]
MLVSLIIILTLSSTSVFALEKCNTNCTNYIRLKSSEMPLNITMSPMPIRVKVYPEEHQVYVLSRKLYRHISQHVQAGGSTVELFDGPYLPDEAETMEWVNKEKCKIGSICYPNGDCYGDGLRHCEHLGLNPSWTNNKRYTLKGSVWTETFLFLKQRCIQDWECSIYKKYSFVYVNAKGSPYIKPGRREIYINTTSYNVDNGFVIYNKDKVEHETVDLEARCINFNGEKSCNFAFEGKHYSFSLKEKKCVPLRNLHICSKGRYRRDVSPDSIATIDDVKLLSHEVLNFMAFYNYNNMLFQKEILGIKTLLNNIILSSSRYNPFILKDILGINVHSRKQGDSIQACSCQDLDFDCVLNKKIHLGDSKCFYDGNTQYVDLLNIENIESVVPDSLEMRGKEESVFENEIEREMAHSESFVNPNTLPSGSFLPDMGSLPGMWVFQSVSQFLPFVNMFLIFFFRR